MGQSTLSRPLGQHGRSREFANSAQLQPGEESLARDLLTRTFDRLSTPLWLRLWSGPAFRVGAPLIGAEEVPRFIIVFQNPRAVWTTVLGRDPLRLAECYFRGDLDIEGDLFAALDLRHHLDAIGVAPGSRLSMIFSALRLRARTRGWERSQMPDEPSPFDAPTVRLHSRDENRDAIQFHYDVSNEFYALWLDRAMVYSCAYFEDAETGLEAAQQAKLEHICRKLMLKPGDRFLDIGCGWGALAMYAARHYGVRAHGITLSEKQVALARKRVQEAGLEARVTVELLDYRDLPGEEIYDKVASVGMIEHVGLNNLPTYFATVQRVLKPAGLFLNHGITHELAQSRSTLPIDFINRYVFPDGQLDCLSHIQLAMENAHFEIADVEGLRSHYALTLRHWVRRLEQRHERILEYVDEATYRIWRLYMSACALEFESGALGIYQVVAAKRAATNLSLPLTRRHLYCDSVEFSP
jgi:cyclopropane-fatty-acyl-phospholipid synthase